MKLLSVELAPSGSAGKLSVVSAQGGEERGEQEGRLTLLPILISHPSSYNQLPPTDLSPRSPEGMAEARVSVLLVFSKALKTAASHGSSLHRM